MFTTSTTKKHLLHFHGVEIASFGDDLSARTIGFVQTPLAVLMTIGPFSNIPAGQPWSRLTMVFSPPEIKCRNWKPRMETRIS